MEPVFDDSYEDTVFRYITNNPSQVVQILSQIGYEPQPKRHTLWFDYCWFYPNPFRVINNVVRNHGVLALFHGVWERLSTDMLFYAITTRLHDAVGLNRRGGSHYLNCVKDVGCRVATRLLSHPLKVVVLRKMLQVASAEVRLSHSPVAVALQIWREEGWCGLYSGLTPALFSEVVSFATSYALVYYKSRYPHGFGPTLTERIATNVVDVVIGYGAYGMGTVATVMMAGPAGVSSGAAPYRSWSHCLWELALQKRLYRGAYTLWWDNLYVLFTRWRDYK